MTLRKVSPGQPLRITADTFNAFVDAAAAYQASQQDLSASGTALSRQAGIVPVRNDSGVDQDRFAILGLSDPLILPSENPQAFTERIAFSAVAPDPDQHRERFAILQEPIPAGGMGRALIAGVTPVLVNIADAADDFAAVGTTSGYLESGGGGGARILWKDTGTGVQWAIVQVPAGSSGRSMPPLSVFGNPTNADAEGTDIAADADGQALMRISGTLQFVALPSSGLGDRSPCSVIGRAANSFGPAADISTGSDNTVLMRVAGQLQWLQVVPRLQFGSVGGVILFLGPGTTAHQFDGSAGAWIQTNNGRTRYFVNFTDYWEITANAGLLDIVGWVNGVQKHRIQLNPAMNLSGANRTLGLREIDVCDNGVARKIAIIASDPY